MWLLGTGERMRHDVKLKFHRVTGLILPRERSLAGGRNPVVGQQLATPIGSLVETGSECRRFVVDYNAIGSSNLEINTRSCRGYGWGGGDSGTCAAPRRL